MIERKDEMGDSAHFSCSAYECTAVVAMWFVGEVVARFSFFS